MSQTAVMEAPETEPVERALTWRDAVTPVSRASRRRWVAVYPLLLAGGGVVVGAPDLLRLGEESGVALGFLVAMAIVFGMLRRGTRRLTAFDHPDLDERDASARADAFRAAYPLLITVVVLSLVALFVVLPEIVKTTREVVSAGNVSRSTTTGLFLSTEALTGLMLWGFLWAVFLPTGVLAWREPDALERETVTRARGISEPVRDALLGLAVAVGLAATLAEDTSFWVLLALLLVLTGLGARARRVAGAPAVSTYTTASLGVVLVVLGALVAVVAVADVVVIGLAALLALAGFTLIGLAFKRR